MDEDSWASSPSTDLLLEIFRRLNASDVVRCACACKTWRRAIIANASSLHRTPSPTASSPTSSSASSTSTGTKMKRRACVSSRPRGNRQRRRHGTMLRRRRDAVLFHTDRLGRRRRRLGVVLQGGVVSGRVPPSCSTAMMSMTSACATL